MTIKVRTARASRGLRGRFVEGVAAERLIGVASPILLLALWEGAGRVGVLDARFFPAPSAIAGTFVDLMRSGELVEHTWTSLGRILIGFTLGAVPGLVIGIAMGLSRLVRAAFKPVVGALYPVPKTAIFPLLLLVFGIGEPSKYAIVAIGVFFLVLLNTMAGVLGIEPVYLDVGRNFGAGRLQVFRTIALPGVNSVIVPAPSVVVVVVVSETCAHANGAAIATAMLNSTFFIFFSFVVLAASS